MSNCQTANRPTAAFLLLAGAACLPGYAQAQETTAPEPDTPIEAGQADSIAQGSGQSYTPEYFAQFAPRNALDMVRRIPGFSIEDGNQGQRGLGEANQNVIVNGARFSSKSESIRDQLQRIPASDVTRIEILDGTSLDIPGLSGQVANVVHKSSGTSGQFEWRTGFRAYNTEAQLYGGEISVTGSSGKLDFTVSLSVENNRFGADGPNLITDGNGALIETQESKFSGKFDSPKLAGNFSYDFGNETIANLNLSYGGDFVDRRTFETGLPPGGPLRERISTYDEKGPEYEIGGDVEFPLGPGKLKLIALESFDRENGESELIDRFDDGAQSTGFRFLQTNEIGERIGRAEYSWRMLGGDWQVSGEAAFNRLNRKSQLFELDADENFVELAFPEGTGGVTEDRYEAIVSYNRVLTPELSLQLSGGAEYSKIEQTGIAANARSFQRPKGSAAITWKPEDDFDVSLEVRRRVGQLSFGDFLASVSLNDDNENSGNNELVPDQSWNVDLEINKGLGAWGSAKLEFEQVWFEDFIDFFPLAGGGEARGNIGDAKRTQVELNTTLNGDPVGWRGARLEVKGIRRWDRVTDPFTGEERPFSGRFIDLLELDFRHDIPATNLAWGTGLFTDERAFYSRRFESGRGYEGPVFLDVFVEHKDVFGLTVKATYANVLNARNKFDRTVFDGDRPDAPILFVERSDRRIGPIFRFSVKGNF